MGWTLRWRACAKSMGPSSDPIPQNESVGPRAQNGCAHNMLDLGHKLAPYVVGGFIRELQLAFVIGLGAVVGTWAKE